MIISEVNEEKTLLQNVKQRFFALRNGMLADTLRKAGAPYSIIFGLNLPQLREIAEIFSPGSELAETLWANKTTRESRLLAPMIADRDAFTTEDARRWLASLSGSPEEVDNLCHWLLRHRPYALELASELADDEQEIKRYAALRLMFSQIKVAPDLAKEMAKRELDRNVALTRIVAQQLLDEVDFLAG